MSLDGGFTERPPNTITGPFEFRVQATNNSNSGETYSFEAVLINPSTGEEAAQIWSTNVFFEAGGTKDLVFQLAETRELNIPDGSYDLQVLYETYPSGTQRSLANKGVQVDLKQDGSNGGGGSNGGNGSNGGGGSNPADNISINISNQTGDVQYAWMSFDVMNTSNQTIDAEVEYSPSPSGQTVETLTVGPDSTLSTNVEWFFNNQSKQSKQLCVNLKSARFV